MAVELKIGEFQPEFVGKMQFYLAALDGQEREEDVLVELSPDHLTFRNFSALADFLEELYGRKVDLLTIGGLDPLIRQDVESEVVWCEA